MQPPAKPPFALVLLLALLGCGTASCSAVDEPRVHHHLPAAASDNNVGEASDGRDRTNVADAVHYFLDILQAFDSLNADSDKEVLVGPDVLDELGDPQQGLVVVHDVPDDAGLEDDIVGPSMSASTTPTSPTLVPTPTTERQATMTPRSCISGPGNMWLMRCASLTVCASRRQCRYWTDCPPHHSCGLDGRCGCKYYLRDNYDCYGNSLCAISHFKRCGTEGMCSTDPADFLSTAMSLAMTFGACFVGIAAALLACRTWLGCHLARRVRSPLSGQPDDGDTESVSSMQRWINDRLRDRPPRYEDMDAVATAAAASAPRSGTAASQGVDGTAGTADAEKPPPYDFVVNEAQTASIFYQPLPDEGPPPAYTALAATLLADSGPARGFNNPCFLDDAGASVTGPGASGTGTGSGSGPPSTAPVLAAEATDGQPTNLLTLSQVVALREMAMAEEAAHGATGTERTEAQSAFISSC